MNGNNGNGSRQNRPVNKMEQAPTRHQPRRGVRNLSNARAVAQAAPQVRVSGPVRGSRKASRMNQNKTPYARAPKNNAKKANKGNNALSLSGLSFGNSSFKMKRFNPKKASSMHNFSYPSSAASSGFVPLNAHQAFQSQMNETIARQAAANRQRLANITQHRRNGAKKAAVTRKAKKEALQAAAAAAMADVEEAKQVVVAQEQSAAGPSNIALQALANAQRAAQNADAAFRRALANENNNNNGSSAPSAASAASGNNLSSMFGRL